MKIYLLTTYDGTFDHYFKGTKAEADDLAETYLTNRAEGQTAEVECIEFEPTPDGVAGAMQEFADSVRYGDA